jgi:DME family drug/metabolite transporter
VVDSTNRRGYLLVVAAATLWGTTGTSQALAPTGATPPVVGALRLAVGGVVLVLIALWRGGFKTGRRWPIRATFLAAVCMAAYQIFFFGGVALTGVAIGTIVGIGSCPIMGGLLGYFFRAEHPGRAWIIATLLAVGGAALLASTGGKMHINLWGLLMAVGAGIAYAAFTLFSKELLDSQPSEPALAVVFCLGALLLSPLLFTSDLHWLLQPSGALVTAHLGLVTVGLAYTLFGKGLQLVPVSTTTTLTLAEPLTAGILGITLLGERLTLTAALGILLIFSGIVVLSVMQPKPAPKMPPTGN